MLSCLNPVPCLDFAAETQIQIYILIGIVTSMYCIDIGKYGFILFGGGQSGFINGLDMLVLG